MMEIERPKIETASLSPDGRYGKFVAEPLERGFGITLGYMTELLGRGAMDMTSLTGGKPGGGSEDFAFVSHEVPTVSMFLSAGNAKEGYLYGQHHPKVRFDDSVLYEGSAAYTYMALRWLADHKE